MNKLARATATLLATIAVSAGIAAVAAPAHADTSWGYSTPRH